MKNKENNFNFTIYNFRYLPLLIVTTSSLLLVRCCPLFLSVVSFAEGHRNELAENTSRKFVEIGIRATNRTVIHSSLNCYLRLIVFYRDKDTHYVKLSFSNGHCYYRPNVITVLTVRENELDFLSTKSNVKSKIIFPEHIYLLSFPRPFNFKKALI